MAEVGLEGALEKLAVQPGHPARYRLEVRDGGTGAAGALALNALLGRSVSIEYRDRISCAECGAATARAYAGGYCYRCARRLARCDLCVVSPARCHFHRGTCREPEWGRAFCMQPHRVYLANSSGPKVGITRAGGEISRWLDQGASQGLVIADAPTRHLAGLLEVALARHVSDRTNWRALLRGPAEPVDLAALRDRLRERVGDLPDGVDWRRDGEAVDLDYPLLGYPREPRRLRLDRHPRIAGRLIGVKGQYLLFEHGVFSVVGHRSFHVCLRVLERGAATVEAPAASTPTAADSATDGDTSQLELFS